MVVVCLGLPGSGKSRFLGRLALVRLGAARRVGVYCPHRRDSASHPEDPLRFARWLEGGRPPAAPWGPDRLVATAELGRLDALVSWACAVRPSVLWLDEVEDLTSPSGRVWRSDRMRSAWGQFRHADLEIWAAAHSPLAVPRSVTRHADATLLFRCAGEPSDLRYLSDRYGAEVAARVVSLPFPTWAPVCYGMPDAAARLGLVARPVVVDRT